MVYIEPRNQHKYLFRKLTLIAGQRTGLTNILDKIYSRRNTYSIKIFYKHLNFERY